MELPTSEENDKCSGAESIATPDEREEGTFGEPGSSLSGGTSAPSTDVGPEWRVPTAPPTR